MTESDERSVALSEIEILELLRNGRRRAVLDYLGSHGNRATVRELAEHVGRSEYGVARDGLSADQYKRVYTGLRQCHIPRLADAGVVEFDRDGNFVSLGETASQVATYIDGRPRSTALRIELVVAFVVAALVTLGVIGVWPLGSIPVEAFGLLTMVALVGLGLVDLVD